MSKQDRDYYLRRAECELALARSAGHPAAMRAHYHLAGFYLDRAYARAGDSAVPIDAISVSYERASAV